MAITVATGGVATNSTTVAPGLGGTASAGDLYLCAVGKDGNGTLTVASPGVEIKDQSFTGAIAGVFYLIASGGETAFPLITASASERFEWAVWRFPAGEWHGTTPPEINTGVTGSDTAPNPGSIAPSWGAEDGTIILPLCVRDDSAANTVTAYPTGYDTAQADKNDVTSAANVAGAAQIFTTGATSYDPGAFTISATETWIAFAIAVRPAAGGGTTENASAALTAAATMAVAAVVTRRGAAALSATATLAATSRADRAASASLSATATLAAVAQRVKEVAASLNASASMSVAVVKTVGVGASLTGVATISGAAVRTRAIAAALSANASLQAAGVRVLSGRAALSAVATLSATAEFGAASVEGDAVLVFTDSMIAVLSNADAIAAGITFPDSHEATLVV